MGIYEVVMFKGLTYLGVGLYITIMEYLHLVKGYELGTVPHLECERTGENYLTNTINFTKW